jgi:hypothetical protein
MVGYPRTGSSHLVSLLDSHPDIACWDDEVFGDGEVFDHSSYQDPRDFLRNSVFQIDAHAAGFKWLWREMSRFTAAWEILKELDISLIHTYRDNLLDSFISYQLATINRAFTSWYGEYKITSFEATHEDCLEWFESAEHCDCEIRKHSREAVIPRLEIEYHELCKSQDRVLDFLDVPPRPLTSRLQKQRMGGQARIIENYRGLKAKFIKSRWAKHFEE